MHLSEGMYSLQVSYENGCAFNNEWNLVEPDSLFVHFDISDVLCYGDSSGSALVSETNAEGYFITWENADPTKTTLLQVNMLLYLQMKMDVQSNLP